MDVDCKHGRTVDGVECGNQRLAGVAPGVVERIDAAGVEFEFGAGEDLVLVSCGAGVRVAKGEEGRLVEVGDADVAVGLTAVLVVDGRDLGEGIGDARELLNGVGKSLQRYIAGNNAAFGGTVIVLDFLEEYDVGGAEVVDDLVCDEGEMRRGRGEVLDVVGAKGEALTGTVGFQGCGWRKQRQGIRSDRERGEREDAIEPESVGHDAGNIAEGVSELGGGIGRLVERLTDDCGAVSTNSKQ